MCTICAAFHPYDPNCEYEGLTSGTSGGPGTPYQFQPGNDVMEAGDASASTNTNAAIGSGDFFFGTIESGTASDWIEVQLVAGQTYTFAMVGTGGPGIGVRDPLIRLRDANGSEIAVDDDGGPGRTSSLTFTATSSGTYYLDAQTWSTSAGGEYVVSMTEGSVANFNIEMGAGILIRSGSSWSGSAGTPVNVTWGVRDTGPGTNGEAFDSQGDPAPFSQLSAAQVAATQSALALFAGVSGLTFTQVNPGGTTDNASVLVGAYSGPNDGAGAFAYFPGSTSSGSVAGDIWLDNTAVSTSSLNFGSYSYFTILHEIGHAVGLSHPGDYNAAPGTSISYANSAQFTQDSHQYTVMSYFDERYTTTSLRSYPDTLMLFDIYALHQLYGADYSFHAHDTVYGFNATVVNSPYDFTVNTTPLLSIWDGAGEDTLDMSGYADDQVISLIDGTFSSVGGYSGNLSIAYGAIIEHAIGGSGDDQLTGNAVANEMIGGLGDDTLAGNAGNDTLFGGVGNDEIDGGIGQDILFGQTGDDRLSGGANADRIFGGDGFDTIHGGGGNDFLMGAMRADEIYGEAGDDTIYGGFGFDTLEGGAGADFISGGNDADQISGGDNNDTLRGDNGNDTISGDNGDDLVFGGAGNDQIAGGGDDDMLFGEGGFDTLDGGAGNDLLNGGLRSDTLLGGAGEDTLYGGFGFDRIEGGDNDDLAFGGQDGDLIFGGRGDDTLYGDDGADQLFGQTGNDEIFGGSANDVLNGGQGDDTLNGGTGADRLIGWTGDDVLTGGIGADAFVFATGHGNDTITDFETGFGLDKIDLSAISTISNMAQLNAAASNLAGGVLIQTGSGSSIFLSGISESELTVDHFHF